MNLKRTLSAILCAAVALTACANLTGCSSKEDEQVIIYSNADDEAVESMKKTLDANGYEGKYIFQSFGTSELGGKMLAEGKDIEADVITMSSYYIESAENESNMFVDLDLYDQWKGMDKDGKWRFTSPTHVVLAFAKALEELKAEGGIKGRFARYSENNNLLIEKMTALGFRTYLNSNQSPIITTFLYPDTEDFTFEKMYNFIKERGYAIYPGKVTDADVFRIGNIGEIYTEDIENLCDIFEEFFRDEVQI